jgi:hypothetical protein
MSDTPENQDPRLLDLAKAFITEKADEPQIKALTDDQRIFLADALEKGMYEAIYLVTKHPLIAISDPQEEPHRGAPTI